jgi:nucleoid-associated protein YgaU
VTLIHLSKAAILNTVTQERIPVMYNPEELKLDQGNSFAEIAVPGLDTPPVQYVRGRGRTLSMELFFDSYETKTDVRRASGRIVKLLDTLPQTKAPPVLLFSMGRFQFQCVLVDADQRYTMFLRDGTPVRAILSVRFQEFTRIDVELEHGLFIGPPTLHTMSQDQTLPAVAALLLGDPARWREIAQANDIDDPFGIPPGRALRVPSRGPA